MSFRIEREDGGTVAIKGLSVDQVWDLHSGLMQAGEDSDNPERDADLAFAEEIRDAMEGIGER